MSNLMYRRTLKSIDTTYSGKVCQRWDQQFPHQNDIFGSHVTQIVDLPQFEDNNCRDIWDNGYLWCFARDPSTRWEACNVRNDMTVERGCSIDVYNNGRNNMTTSGKNCLSWKEAYDENLRTLQNYCRDPFADGYAWCFVNASSGRGNFNREICEIGG
ncbi:hepatocyte growth factor-like [Mercenaria mercenaria]|uniref:hepatocyte growth factor-like n=1 Tax=Mercenaria mercenaria TaxID=6596 RepID=UPI00234EC8F9|nr:hepatocyte growth factor-like [Mercenaria mercenaria]